MRCQEASVSSDITFFQYVKVKGKNWLTTNNNKIAKKKKKNSSKYVRIMTNSWLDNKSSKYFNGKEIQR